MLEAHGVGKRYGGVVALAGADFAVRAGSVHALLGENGAGKSTLVKIIAGALAPDEGALRLDGEEVRFATTAEAVRRGVAVVSQELNVFPDLDVLANLFTLREIRRGPFISRARMAERARPVLEELGLDVSLRRPVAELSLAQRQLVEIGKALLTEPRILILDEPTSALGAASTETLLDILRVLRDREVGVVFVSHILEDVMALCDEVTVLRDGRSTMSAQPRAELTVPGDRHRDARQAARGGRGAGGRGARRRAARAGRRGARGRRRRGPPRAARRRGRGAPARAQPARHARRDRRARGRRRRGPPRRARARLRHAPPRPGLGDAAERASAVPHGLRRAIGSGVALVSGDRRRLGLMLDKPLWENIGQIRSVGLAADGPIVRAGRLRERARAQIDGLRIRSRSVDQLAGSLSGGNQQKVVFAKWLDAQPSVILLDDPTRGVDVGAKAEMHALIRSAAEAGAPVLICSTDIDELASLCDRVVVLRQGRVSATLSGDALTTHAVLEAMNTDALEPAA